MLSRLLFYIDRWKSIFLTPSVGKTYLFIEPSLFQFLLNTPLTFFVSLGQCQSLLNLLYLFINEPIIRLNNVFVNLLVVWDMTEVKQIMSELSIFKITQLGFNTCPSNQNILQLFQLLLRNSLEFLTNQILLRVTRSTSNWFHNFDSSIVKGKQHDQLTGQLESTIINF